MYLLDLRSLRGKARPGVGANVVLRMQNLIRHSLPRSSECRVGPAVEHPNRDIQVGKWLCGTEGPGPRAYSVLRSTYLTGMRRGRAKEAHKDILRRTQEGEEPRKSETNQQQQNHLVLKLTLSLRPLTEHAFWWTFSSFRGLTSMGKQTNAEPRENEKKVWFLHQGNNKRLDRAER